MQRNKAMAVATALLGVVIAVTTAVALNLGILSETSAEPVATDDSSVAAEAAAAGDGVVDEPETSDMIIPGGTEIITVYVDEPTAPGAEPAPAAPRPAAPTTWRAPTASAPATSSPAATAPAPSAPAATAPAPAASAPASAPVSAPAPTPAPATPTPAPPPPAPTPVPSPTPVPTAAPPAVTYPIYSAGSAGDVAIVYDGSSIGFWGAYPNNGWEYMVEDNGPRKVKIKFRSPSGGEIEFQAELNGNSISVEVGD